MPLGAVERGIGGGVHWRECCPVHAISAVVSFILPSQRMCVQLSCQLPVALRDGGHLRIVRGRAAFGHDSYH